MDRVTRKWVEELEQLRSAPWKPGEKFMGADVHSVIDTLVGLCRSLSPGSVIVRQEREAKLLSRLEAQRESRRFLERIDHYLAVFNELDTALVTVTEGILISLGYRRHNRDNWRMPDTVVLQRLKETLDPKNQAKSQPLLTLSPPADEVEALRLFARARNGDADALKRVDQLIRDRECVIRLGDLGCQATEALLTHVAEGDPVSGVAVREHVKDVVAELLGDNPSVLDRLLARRVIHGWIAVNTLQLELAVRPPDAMDLRDHLDKALSRVQRRYIQAIHEFARVRRLPASKKLRNMVGADPIGRPKS